MFKNVILGFIATIMLSACNDASNSASSAQVASQVITIQNARIRAMPPGQKVTAMFVTLNNASATPHKLVQAKSNISENVELHEHKHVNGMMQMQQVESIAIPANGAVSLQPGGYHIMMINLKKDLKLGQKVDVSLVFEDDSTISLQVEVKPVQ